MKIFEDDNVDVMELPPHRSGHLATGESVRVTEL